jgi:hypothetical protein
MRTTRGYMQMAGVVFRDESDALERRFGLTLSTEAHTEPTAADRHELSLDDA